MAIGGRRRHTALQNIDSERTPFKAMDGFIAPRASDSLPCHAGGRDEGQKRTTDGS